MNKARLFSIVIIISLLTACGGKAEAISDSVSPLEQIQSEAPKPEASAPTASSKSAEPAKAGIGDNVTVSRALVAKMLTMAFYDMNTINNTDREISFTDTPKDAWYDKYVNSAYVYGLMKGGSGLFMPELPITLSQAQTLLNGLDENNNIKLQLTDQTKDKPISYALWVDFYKKLLEHKSGAKTIKDNYDIEEVTFVVLATPKNNGQLKSYNMVTDKGNYTYYGLNMDSYIDKEVRVLLKDGDVLAIISIESTTPTIKSAYVVNTDANSITVFSGGAERTYGYKNAPQNITGKLCDIKINGTNATAITVYNEKISGVIKKVTPDNIELEGNGVIPLEEIFKVYSVAGGPVKWRHMSNLLVGTNIADFYLTGGKIIGAVITKSASPNSLRVALNTTGFTGLIHDNVSVSGTRAFSVSENPDGGGKMYKAWEPVTITDELFSGKNRIYVKSDGPEGKIVVTSIKRNWGNNESPKYRGFIEISKEENGYIIINEVDFEEYLFAVVPSEMPSAHGVEAAKVQAITARSYAYNEFFTNRFYKYGANVDDSVSSQVYNNVPENETSVKAVSATKGQFLTHNGSVVKANFFSTSGGITANNGDVWANAATNEFPSSTSSFLTSKAQFADSSSWEYGDLRIEQNADKFFKDTSLKAFDSGFGWFRWNVEMTGDEISASVNSALKNRYNARPPLIKTLQGDGVFRSKPIDSIGEVKDITVKKRGQGGNIMEMEIKGTKATILVITEYNVRSLISPNQKTKGGRNIVLNMVDGKTMSNYSIMPSAFYTMDKSFDDSGALKSVKFYGGGNGHGVGMSQNGVKGMLDLGYNVNQILKHYYNGTEVTKMP